VSPWLVRENPNTPCQPDGAHHPHSLICGDNECDCYEDTEDGRPYRQLTCCVCRQDWPCETKRSHIADMKTGSGGRTWVTLEQPRPPRVPDRYAYWTEPPPERSERCAYWLRQIQAGWLPSKYVTREGYDGQAQWFGVYLWEYLHVLAPAIREHRG